MLPVGVMFALQPGAALVGYTGSGDLGTLPTKSIFEWLDTALLFLALYARLGQNMFANHLIERFELFFFTFTLQSHVQNKASIKTWKSH